MLKTSFILQLCFHQRSKAIKTIFRLIYPHSIYNASLAPYRNLRPLLRPNIYKISNLRYTSTSTSSLFSSLPDNLDHESDTESQASIMEKKQELFKVVKFLKSRGCNSIEIRNKCMPHINKTNSSYIKAVLISELHPDITLLMPLMSCTVPFLRQASKQARIDRDIIPNQEDRISYLSRHLETPPGELVPPLAKHCSLLTMQFDRLERKMSILRQADIDPKYIVKDLWIFNYKEELLAHRVAKAKEAGVELKPWILRCSVRNFKLIIERNAEAQSVLQGVDEISYLAKRLDCSNDYVEYIMNVNKSLKAIAIPKLDKVLNFLYEKGYTPAEVRLFPRVFCSSVQTLNKRFNEFSAGKSTLPTMSHLCVVSRNRKNALHQKSSPE